MPLRGIPPYDRRRTLSAAGIAVTARSTGLHFDGYFKSNRNGRSADFLPPPPPLPLPPPQRRILCLQHRIHPLGSSARQRLRLLDAGEVLRHAIAQPGIGRIEPALVLHFLQSQPAKLARV